MNIAAQVPGRNSEFDVKICGGYRISPVIMAHAWNAYQASGDGLYESDRFMLQTIHGSLWHFFVGGGDPVKIRATFGLELMHDHRGPYVSFVYFEVQPGVRLRTIAVAVIGACHGFTRGMHDGHGGVGPARMLLRGRDGWQRLLPRLGIKIDPDGWISEDQEAFGYGTQRRQ